MKRYACALAVCVWLAWNGSASLAQRAEDNDIEAAGCYIATPHGVVVNVNRLLSRLQLPMGRHLAGETSAQTAARETLEETGISVHVGSVLLSLNEQRVLLYTCTPVTTITDYAALSPRDVVEVSEVLVLNPHTMRNYDGRTISIDWRFPETWLLLRTLYPSSANP